VERENFSSRLLAATLEKIGIPIQSSQATRKGWVLKSYFFEENIEISTTEKRGIYKLSRITPTIGTHCSETIGTIDVVLCSLHESVYDDAEIKNLKKGKLA
jgi:hypothetical protein